MAVKGIYNFRGLAIPDVFLKVVSITGNEKGWTGQIGAFASDTAVDPLETFIKTVTYRGGVDPFVDFEQRLMEDFPGFVRVTPRRLTQREFLKRFTLQERCTIRAAAAQNAMLDDYMHLLSASSFIDLTDPDTIEGVQTLEAATLLAPGRAAEILEGN